MEMKNCYICDKQAEHQRSATLRGGGDWYTCEDCGRYFLSDWAKTYVDRTPIKHIIAGYFMETKDSREYSSALSQEENLKKVVFTDEVIKKILKEPVIPKTIGQKLDKLLVYLYRQTECFGYEHRVETIPIQVCYSINNEELNNMIAELVSLGFGEYKGQIHGEDGIGFGDGIETPRGYIHRNRDIFILNSKGHVRAETLISTNIDSRKVFVAMQFSGALLEGIKDTAIKPACSAYGFEAYTIDEEEHNDGIFDRIIAGIRTSKFVIADLTYKNAGAYFEAGFAQGLGLEVFRCCNQEWFDEHGVHFDLQHYNLIVWKDAEHLKQRLIDRIGAVFPDTKIIRGVR